MALLLPLLMWAGALPAHAQDNYEIQVYGADTIAPHSTMVELHSNFTLDGSRPLPGSQLAADRVYPLTTSSMKRLR